MAREVFFKGELFDIATGVGLSDRGRIARAALAWVAQHRPDTIILGVDDGDQLRANARTLAVEDSTVDAEIIARIEQAPAFKEYESKRTTAFFES
jgi:aryl-alcohol dehydrogenase-like predicted oxidoreductase